MKRALTALFALTVALAAPAATLSPIQSLNPAGSSSGQTILSTGPNTPPAWGNVSFSTLTGIVPVANGGTGASTQSAALTNLLGSSIVPLTNGGTGSASQAGALSNILGSSTVGLTNGGTGAANAAAARTNLGLGTAAVQNTGTNGANVPLLNGANTWSSAQTFSIRPVFNGATPWDTANLPTVGTAAALNTGTSGGTIPLLNTANTWAAAQTFSVRPTFNGATPWDSTNLPTVGTAVSANTGTSGHVLPYLDTTNTWSGAQGFTGIIIPSQTVGIQGTTTNNSAQAGSVGELANNGAPSAVAITNNTPGNCGSKSLTAGQWFVYGNVFFATVSASPTQLAAGFNTVSATLPGNSLITSMQFQSTALTAGANQSFAVPAQILQLASTTTVYLVGQMAFTSGTSTCTGYVNAFRMR